MPTIRGKQIGDGTIDTADIADSSVTDGKIVSVAESKIVYATKYKTIFRSFTDMWLDPNSPPGWTNWYG